MTRQLAADYLETVISYRILEGRVSMLQKHRSYIHKENFQNSHARKNNSKVDVRPVRLCEFG
jgi:hypothetical protein